MAPGVTESAATFNRVHCAAKRYIHPHLFSVIALRNGTNTKAMIAPRNTCKSGPSITRIESKVRMLGYSDKANSSLYWNNSVKISPAIKYTFHYCF